VQKIDLSYLPGGANMHSHPAHVLGPQAPLYLADDCRLVSDNTRRSLRSADVSTCVVPQTLSTYGDRAFVAFSGSTNTALCDFWYAAPQKNAYLLTYTCLSSNGTSIGSAVLLGLPVCQTHNTDHGTCDTSVAKGCIYATHAMQSKKTKNLLVV